jgi:S1-C subfamily serine protease
LARSIGQRIETIEIAASADFPVGARVTVPVKPTFPRNGTVVTGVVETTGTALQVRLDNGETWHGPPSLARLEAVR